MRAQFDSPVAKQLKSEVVEIIDSAIRALEAGQSTALARNQLREVSRRLTELELEYRGGCSW